MSTATATPARPYRAQNERNAPPQKKYNTKFSKRPPSSKAEPKPEAEILFQTYFKSVGPRTYAAQVKRAGNGNHFVVLTEGKRDDKTDEIRKTRLFVFSEDFTAFFKMLHEAAIFIRENPVPDDVKKKREQYWAKNGDGSKSDEPKRALTNTASTPAGAKAIERPKQAPAHGAGQRG
jgi:hypothetical protein